MDFRVLKNSDDSEPAWLTNAIRNRMKNASAGTSQIPKVYYGMHFSEGVAEYRERGVQPYRVLINESTAKQMDATFPGRPVVVLHTDESLEEILPDIMAKADGFVVESFFNEADGKHWAKFLAITDRAHEAISKGWSLSNCYRIRSKGAGGMWHGVDFQNEVFDGVYEHLAIVPNPRYESRIYDPEEFKAYNAEKKMELQRLANSNNDEGEGIMPKFNFFKRQKLENSADLESTMVELPKSKKQMTVSEALEKLDVIENMQGYCNMDHMVKVGEEEMSVNDLVGKFSKMNADKKAADEAAAEGAGEGDDAAFDNEDEDMEGDDEELENDGKDPAAMKAKNAADKAEAIRLKNAAEVARKEKKEKGKDFFNKLSNASDLAALKAEKEETVLDTERAQLARGQERYGKK